MARLHDVTRGLPRVFWALWAGLLINRAGSFVQPMQFVYLTQFRGVPLTTAGEIVSLYGLGTMLGTWLGGVGADAVGRRRTMLLSLVSGAGAMLLLGASTSLWQLAGSSFLLGTAGTAYGPASHAMVADVVAPEHRMKAFSAQYWAVNLGFSVAMVLAGVLVAVDLWLVFAVDAATTLAMAVVVYLFIPESRPAATQAAHQASPGNSLTPFFDPRFAPYLALNSLLLIIFFQHLSGLPEDMRSKGLPASAYGPAVAWNGVLIVLLQPFAPLLLARLDRRVALALSSALVALGFGLTGLATSYWPYVATVVLWTLGEILFAPVNAALVAELAPPRLRGRYQGAYSLTWGLGAVVSPVLGAAVAERFGLSTLWAACAVLGLTVAAGYLAFNLRPRAIPADDATP